MRGPLKTIMAAIFLLLAGSSPPEPRHAVPGTPQRFEGTLAVMTYNVKGLPWPVAVGRGAAFDRIAARLRRMRERGGAPQVVVLQEAFTAEAQAIGAAAGYRYIVSGLPADVSTPAVMEAGDRRFAAGGRWWKGETEGKWIGSGLLLMSDYPVVAVRRMAFPTFACAGYDCLANKGALLVTLAIPGAPSPVDVLTTHLNSRRASHAAMKRSLYAYRRQVGALTAFIRAAHDPSHPLIAAGDFNVGGSAPRRSALLGDVQQRWAAGPVRDALRSFRSAGGRLAADAAFSLRRARDWQFYADGGVARLTLTGIDVPFGHEPGGGMLSDHVGYVARYRFDRRGLEAEAPTTPSRSKA